MAGIVEAFLGVGCGTDTKNHPDFWVASLPFFQGIIGRAGRPHPLWRCTRTPCPRPCGRPGGEADG